MLISECEMDLNEMCSFCGEHKAEAVWMGAAEVFCCRHCAVEYLPQLMADAIVGGTPEAEIRNSEGATIKVTKEERILGRFRGAFSSALIRKLRTKQGA